MSTSLTTSTAATPNLTRTLRTLAAWVPASVLGFTIGTMAVFIGGWIAVDAVTGDADRLLEDGLGFGLHLTAAFALGGALMAVGQWAAVRPRRPGLARWAGAAALGWATVSALYVLFEASMPIVINAILHNLIGGAIIGLLQAPILAQFRDVTKRTWMAASAAAMLIAGTGTEIAVALIPGIDHSVGQMLGVALASTLTGVVVGSAAKKHAPRA